MKRIKWPSFRPCTGEFACRERVAGGAEIEMRILLAPLLKLEFSIQHSDRLPLDWKLQTIGVKKWSASIMADG